MTSLTLSKQNSLSHAVFERFAKLNLHGKVVATYLYVDNWSLNMVGGERVKAKSRVLEMEQARGIETLPVWTVPCLKDPTNVRGILLEHQLVPVKIYKDPFLGPPHILVLTHGINEEKAPTIHNHRMECEETTNKARSHEPWFGFEQEFFFVETDGQILGWPKSGYPAPMGPSYCGTGASRTPGRSIVDSHLKACLYSGLNIFGTAAELVLGQWEFQTGPTLGIDAADELWVARYLLCRVAEDFGVDVTFKPAPIPNTCDWMGSGIHANFSTKEMRDPKTGIKVMEEACEKLRPKHAEHLKKYDLTGGEENKKRLGEGFDKFTWGYEDRGVSIRIPEPCKTKRCGYIEDRRPSSNCDPYLVVDMLLKTVCLDE